MGPSTQEGVVYTDVQLFYGPGAKAGQKSIRESKIRANGPVTDESLGSAATAAVYRDVSALDGV